MSTVLLLGSHILGALILAQTPPIDPLGHPDPDTRYRAIKELGRLGKKGTVHIPSLIKAFSADKVARNRSASIDALCDIDATDPRVYATVLRALDDPSIGVGCDAVFRLSSDFGDRPLRDLTAILNDKKRSPIARSHAACGLDGVIENHVKGDIPKEVMDSIEVNLFDEDEMVRLDVCAMVRGIVKRQPNKAPIAIMVRAFTTDKSELMQINMRSALPKCGKRILPYMKQSIRHENEDIRFMTLRILDDLAEDARPLLPEIRAALMDPSKMVCDAARETLRTLEER
jgi:hypothetical protein